MNIKVSSTVLSTSVSSLEKDAYCNLDFVFNWRAIT